MGAKQAVAENADRKYLAIARILRPQGRKGEVAAEILTDFPERFQALQTVYLETGSAPPKPARLERSWPHKGQIVLKLEGVDSIDSATALRGSEVLIPWSDRTPLPGSLLLVRAGGVPGHPGARGTGSWDGRGG